MIGITLHFFENTTMILYKVKYVLFLILIKIIELYFQQYHRYIQVYLLVGIVILGK